MSAERAVVAAHVTRGHGGVLATNMAALAVVLYGVCTSANGVAASPPSDPVPAPFPPGLATEPETGCLNDQQGLRLAFHGGTACDTLVATATSWQGLALPGLAGPVKARWSRTVRLAQGHLYEVSLDLARADGKPGMAVIAVQAPGVTRHLVGGAEGRPTRVAFQFEALGTGDAEVTVTTLDVPVDVGQLRVQRVAEAGSVPWLAAGLACMGLLLNRRRPNPLLPKLSRR